MFVGRSAELETLLDLTAHAGKLSSALVLGPAGMGKTTLCEQFAEHAGSRGSCVAWGRAWELGGAPAFHPWISALAALDAVASGDKPALCRARALLENDAQEISSRARVELFRAVGRALSEATSQQPLVIILDDLHASDVETLELASYVQREPANNRVLLLMTARDAGTNPTTARVHELLTDLERYATRCITLEGLDANAVDEWLPWFCGRTPPADLARQLVELTGGNPYFVREVVAAQRGDLEALALGQAAVPRRVRDVIQRQLSFVPAEAQEFLRTAAAFGRQVRLHDLAELLGREVPALIDALAPAVDARLLHATADHAVVFAHALVCDTLYEALPAGSRARVHAAIAALLDREGTLTRVAERARHALLAARIDPIHAPHALSACAAAGAAALRHLAFEEAARQASNALDMARSCTPAPIALAEAELVLAEACAALGRRQDALLAYERAGQLALACADAELGARVVLGLSGLREFSMRDDTLVTKLEQALLPIRERESELVVRVLTRLVQALVPVPGTRARQADLAEQAVAIARRIGSEEGLALALEARLHAVYGPDSIVERLETAEELLRNARVRRNVAREISALGWQLSALLERGEIASALPKALQHQELADAERLAGPRINARSRRATLYFLQGRFDEGFALAREAHAIGVAAKDPGADLLYWAQLIIPCELLGEHAQLERGLSALMLDAERVMHAHAIDALATRALIALGREHEARARLSGYVARKFADIPDDFVRVGTLVTLADALVSLGAPDGVAALSALLAPYADCNAMIGTAVSLGCVARALGRLAMLEGRLDDAERFLRRACEQNRRMQAVAFWSWSEAELAMLLQRLGRRDEARALAQSAHTRASAHALRPLIAYLEPLTAAPWAPETVPPAVRVVALARAGSAWLLIDGERRVSLGNLRGLTFLARLLATPGEEVHALELVAEGQTPRQAAGDALLDARAKAELRARLHVLRSAFSEAEDAGDGAQAQRVRLELETLEDHLTRALGLGGRSRKLGSAAEKARVSVAVAMRRAIDGIGRQWPEIADHFRRSLRTGVFCCYDPDPATALRVTM